jgi:hypothetical protein
LNIYLLDPQRPRKNLGGSVRADRQRSDHARGDPGRGHGAISEELGRLEGVGEAGGDGVRRLEQRGAVAFAGMAVAVVVILIITVWEYLF